MSKELIFEIGAEELPASFIPGALVSLEGLLRKALDSSRLSFTGIRALGGPRRLALVVKGLPEKQSDSLIEARGPQKRAAFDEAGNPTKALRGFVMAHGASEKDIKILRTEKGEYVCIEKKLKGERTSKILPDILRSVVSGDFFPKSMRWGDGEVSFARPVHWLMAVYGGRKVNFEWGRISSSSVTYGHRFLSGARSPRPIKVADEGSYIQGLRDAFIIVDPEERKRIIIDGLAKEAAGVRGAILKDDGLLEEVTYLVEYPVVVRGSFDPEFLGLPSDVIINAMREHQRYFSVLGEDGGLLPYFLTVANIEAPDMGLIRKGNERVLRARLNDAKFYFEKDVKKRLVERVGGLKGVIFQARLGTSYEKAERFTELALHIGGVLGFSDGRPDERPSDFLKDELNPATLDPIRTSPAFRNRCILGRAAMLSKADLTSGMVGEFPKLQGIMGSIYAKRDKELDDVSRAICEHYLPVSSGGTLPASTPGAIISIADKFDTITGCFGVGLIPTGAQDPYALRRQALGIISIALDRKLKLPLDGLADASLSHLEAKLTRDKGEVKRDVLDFFKERLRNMLLAEGISFDSIDAVLSAPSSDIMDAVSRIRALEGFKKHPFCANLTVAFKRASNILKGQDPVEFAPAPDPGLFRETQEKELYEARERIAPEIKRLWKSGNYEALFETLASIKGAIDAFFDRVMVMVEDESLRTNRLRLLNSVRNLYSTIADLSKLAS